jgi:transposase
MPASTSTASFGIDVSKDKLDVCLLLNGQPRHHCFENSASGLKLLVAWCQKLGLNAPVTVLESTGFYSELATTTLHDAGFPVHLANPRRIKDYARSRGRRNKTDRIDAALIADFAAGHPLPAWQPPSPEQLLLRQLLRQIQAVETTLLAYRNRLQVAPHPAIAKSHTRLIRALEKEIDALQTQLAAHLHKSPALHDDIERLCQIEGIGQRTAAWLCAELPRHLPNARAAAAWLSVTPRRRQSGSSLHYTAGPGAEGNRYLRRSLFMAALVARRHNPRLKTFADRLAKNGKSKLQVVCAVLHKLLKISFAILKHHSHYQPLHSPIKTPQN